MSDPTESTDTDPQQRPSLRKLALDTALFTVVVLSFVFLAGYFFRAPLEQMARQLVQTTGYAGMFAGVFIADAFTFPLPPDVYLFISIAGGSDVGLTLAACSAASVIAGNVAYLIGPYIQQIPLLRQRLEDFRPRGEYLFGQWGGRAVAISALTPIPFSIVSWLAGIYRMPYPSYALASLFRIPRIAGYYALYAYGWAPAIT